MNPNDEAGVQAVPEHIKLLIAMQLQQWAREMGQMVAEAIAHSQTAQQANITALRLNDLLDFLEKQGIIEEKDWQVFLRHRYRQGEAAILNDAKKPA